MGAVFASGSLVDVAQNVFVDLSGSSHNKIGIRLSGVFGATGKITLSAGPAGVGHRVVIIDPANSSLAIWDTTEVGLYFFRAMYDTVKLGLSAGTDGVTNIGWTIYLPSRP